MGVTPGHRNVVPLKLGHRNGLSVLTNRHGIPFYSPAEIGEVIPPFDHSLIFNQITQIVFSLSGALSGRKEFNSGETEITFNPVGNLRSGKVIPDESRMMKVDTMIHFWQSGTPKKYHVLKGNPWIVFDVPGTLAYLMKQNTRRGELLIEFNLPDTSFRRYLRIKEIMDIRFMIDSIPLHRVPNGKSRILFNQFAVVSYKASFGLYYNSFVVRDHRMIAPEGWHVPNMMEWYYLIDDLGLTWLTIGGKLREKPSTWWYTPNDTTDEYLFSLRGSGKRYYDGTWIWHKFYGYILSWNNMYSNYAVFTVQYNSPTAGFDSSYYNNNGYPIRYVKDDQDDPGSMIDNDGIPYRTIKIGNMVITRQNVRTRHYRNDYSVAFGQLYNWWACINSKNIGNTGWRVMTYSEMVSIKAYLDPYAGDQMKIKDKRFWSVDSTINNNSGFSALPSGMRNYDGSYYNIYESFGFFSSFDAGNYGGIGTLTNAGVNLREFYVGTANKKQGYPCRLVAESTELGEGETGLYIGNDGKEYETICINGIEIMTQNLNETKYRDGTNIPEITDNYLWSENYEGARCTYLNGSKDIPEVTGNNDWANLTSGALCAWENDWNNV